ncbi:hypothetical protein [Flavobacterium sp. ZB4P13]|uniref:hypothetical protein n=1 Tax=Flavobacterium sp. ZB4P13 TaxID=3401728 RepID=UPI003AAD33F6
MIQDKITQYWVKTTGRKINPVTEEWIIGPIGDEDIIGDKFIQKLVNEENLKYSSNIANAGLLESISDLDFSQDELDLLNEQVIDFYENTSNYDFEIWSEWKSFFKPFGKALSTIFSKRLQQLNLPLNSLDSSKGIKSEIIKLSNQEKAKWTIWYRKLKSSNDVIYAGIYTTAFVPKYNKSLLKVIFPLPNGNASVVMTKKVLEDGSLLLSSDGNKFGDNGFYFTLTDRKGNYWAKFVKSMHEWIKVYVDDENILRADHNLKFYGIPFLNLHYKMTKRYSSSQRN